MTGQMHAQDCVIGSGAGGSVLAHRLARAGRDVVLLEEGPRVDRHDFTQREEQMYELLYRAAGNQHSADGSIAVMQGRCLGGSTTINMGDCVPAPGSVVDHWRQHHGWGEWGGISNRDVALAQRRVMGEMGAHPVPNGLINRNNALLRDGAAALGLAGGALEHNRLGCVGSGYCLLGCAYDAKRGPALSHLPAAEESGCRVMTGHRVDRLERSGSKVVAVHGEGFVLRTERVFLCAGAIHSAGVLLRSGLESPALGRHLSLQPQGPVVALFEERVDFFRGIPQSWVVDDRLEVSEANGLSGFAIEGISAGPAMAASMLAVPMRQLRPMLARYQHMTAALCLVPDRPVGRVTWRRNGLPKLQYQLTSEYKATLRSAMKLTARIYLEAGAQEVMIPATDGPSIRSEADLKAIDSIQLRSSELPMISAHPQGSCRMGPDRRSSVVGMDFRVHDTENLWVCDASLFPTSSSTHTMVPVMAMADLLASSLS